VSLRQTLRNPVVHRLLLATGFSNLATGIFFGVLPLTVATHGGGPFLIGVVAASLSAWWLLAIPLSVLVDRLGPGPLLRLVAPLRVGSVLVIGSHAFLDGGWVYVPIVVGALLFGLSDVLTDSASSTLPALVLDESQYDDAYSLFSATARVAGLVVGPGAGAAMLAVDTGLPFAVVAASLAVSFACYARFFSHPGAAAAPRPRHPGGWSELVAGVRHVVSDRFLTSVVITLVGVVIAAEVVATVTAPYVRDGLASDAWAQVLGALRSTAGGFAIIAALSAGTLARRFGRLRVLRVVAAAAALSPALMATGAQVPPVLAGLVVAAVGEAIWVPLVQGEMMRRTPAHLLARTRAAVLFVMWGSLPVTSLVGGTVSEAVGVRPSLLVAAAVALVTCSLGIWRPGLGTDGQPGGGAVEPRTTSSGLSRTSTGVASASSMSSSNRSAAR
jgi:hypothetical protein